MLHGENYFLPWAEAERFPESSCPLSGPGPGPCSLEGTGKIGTGWGNRVPEGTYLRGVAKPESVSGSVSASAFRLGVKGQRVLAYFVFVDLPVSER